MEPFDIFIAYLSWGSEGKRRPVLAFITADKVIDVYKITTKYDGKSTAIQSQRFKIDDWKQSGLKQPSYIDVETLITLPAEAFKDKPPIGTLSENDKQRFLEFLAN